jgi:lathosterol oxidase
MISKRGLAFLLMGGACVALTATLPNCIVGDVAKSIAAMKDGTYNPYREFNKWINDLFFQIFQISFVSDMIYEKLGPVAGYYLCCYLRDFVMGTFVYWATAGIWHIAIYHILGNKLFTSKGRAFPSTETLIDQITLAQSSLILYAALPILSEFMIENKITQTYFFVDEVGGWGPYVVYLAIYITLVEIGVYWMHRTLHENKFLYKYVHGLHHKYNKHATLTPWCSLAFNPIDGILQVLMRFYLTLVWCADY